MSELGFLFGIIRETGKGTVRAAMLLGKLEVDFVFFSLVTIQKSLVVFAVNS